MSFLTVARRGAVFFHTLVWKPAALAGFDTGQWSYEHNFQISGGRSGIRKPACSPFGRRSFYATRRGIIWDTSFARRTAPYLDWDFLDSCAIEDLTIGLASLRGLTMACPPAPTSPVGFTLTPYVAIPAPVHSNLLHSRCSARQLGATRHSSRISTCGTASESTETRRRLRSWSTRRQGLTPGPFCRHASRGSGFPPDLRQQSQTDSAPAILANS